MGIFSYLRSGDYLGLAVIIISRLFVILCCMPIHECAHAYAAKKCGDDTAEKQGRLTINPFAHLNLIGAIMIFMFGIGYANPVPVNPAKLKHPRKDFALISAAGPLSNLILSFIFVFIYYFFISVSVSNTIMIIAAFFNYAAQVNIMLAVFNILPIPPLDGAKVFSAILPDKVYFKLMKYDNYIMIALLLLLFLGVLDKPLSFISDILFKVIAFIPSLIFG